MESPAPAAGAITAPAAADATAVPVVGAAAAAPGSAAGATAVPVIGAVAAVGGSAAGATEQARLQQVRQLCLEEAP